MRHRQKSPPIPYAPGDALVWKEPVIDARRPRVLSGIVQDVQPEDREGWDSPFEAGARVLFPQTRYKGVKGVTVFLSASALARYCEPATAASVVKQTQPVVNVAPVAAVPVTPVVTRPKVARVKVAEPAELVHALPLAHALAVAVLPESPVSDADRARIVRLMMETPSW